MYFVCIASGGFIFGNFSYKQNQFLDLAPNIGQVEILVLLRTAETLPLQPQSHKQTAGCWLCHAARQPVTNSHRVRWGCRSCRGNLPIKQDVSCNTVTHLGWIKPPFFNQCSCQTKATVTSWFTYQHHPGKKWTSDWTQRNLIYSFKSYLIWKHRRSMVVARGMGEVQHEYF